MLRIIPVALHLNLLVLHLNPPTTRPTKGHIF